MINKLLWHLPPQAHELILRLTGWLLVYNEEPDTYEWVTRTEYDRRTNIEHADAANWKQGPL